MRLTLERVVSRLFLLLGMFFVVSSFAVVKADNFVQGYNSQGNLTPGWIVELNSGTAVSAAPSSDTSKIYGVVIDPRDSPVALSQNTSGQVFVATSGDYSVLVSTENGPISSGNYISLSSTNGIGAKAVGSQTTVVGRADTGFDGKSGVITRNANYAVGEILVHISVGPNPGYNNQTVNGRLKNLADIISGHAVSPARLYIALVIFVVSLISAISILYAGIKNGMISIGRNPLSKHSVLRGLAQVGVLGIVIFLTGLVAVYLILKV